MPLLERAPCRFIAKQDPTGTHAIALESVGDGLSILSHLEGTLSLELKAGLTIHEARALARLLNERIDGLGSRSPARDFT
jgi:hypothetical protein